MDQTQQTIINSILSVGVAGITGYFSYLAGRAQANAQIKAAESTGEKDKEINLRDDLLELIERQDQKINHLEEVIEAQRKFSDEQRKLADEFRKANTVLAIENLRLKTRVQELEIETIQLRTDLDKIKKVAAGEL